MSYKKGLLYPCNPATERGKPTKLSVKQDKLVYTSGKTVIIRDLKNPSLTTVYPHTKNVHVARFSPTGNYCALGDENGTVKIWDTVVEGQTPKSYLVLPGRINDLAWNGESKHIIAVGHGRAKFCHAFKVETGSSAGTILGHTKAVNAVAIHPQRPYRVATASDDQLLKFYTGSPYNFDKSHKLHSNFVQDVRYASSGEHLVSVGSDGNIFIYNDKADEKVERIIGGHTGSIMACSWSPDDTTLATSSADRTVKLWDVKTLKNLRTWTLGTEVLDQQVGNVWSPAGEIISLSLSGDLNIFDQRVRSENPSRVLKGAQKAITSGTLTSSGTFLAGTADGRIASFSSTGDADMIDVHHKTAMVVAVASAGNTAYSVGFDDQLWEVSLSQKGFTKASTALSKQPKGAAVAEDGNVFISEISKIEVIRSNQKVAKLDVPYGPAGIAAAGKLAAVGGEDKKVHLYDWDGKLLKEVGVLEGNKGIVTSLAFSPDRALLAAGDSTGRILLFNVQERRVLQSSWCFHSARISSLSWTSDGAHLASGSLDTHVYIWSVNKPLEKIAIMNAGPGGVSSVVWLESDGAKGTVVSAGTDACVRTWKVVFKV